MSLIPSYTSTSHGFACRERLPARASIRLPEPSRTIRRYRRTKRRTRATRSSIRKRANEPVSGFCSCSYSALTITILLLLASSITMLPIPVILPVSSTPISELVFVFPPTGAGTIVPIKRAPRLPRAERPLFRRYRNSRRTAPWSAVRGAYAR
ncbi:hypothetical protein C8J57DRAFT_119990 [Mycena rebaudengoi]|nr:hypothetical protein C8J57DRAFT_119990 [Mycena rebaudengoi]